MTNQEVNFQGFLDLAGVEKPSDDIINTCVRCGLCLQSCPTYTQLGREPSSPRGRIALIRGVAENRIRVDAPGFLHQMDECLGCLACQAVCPSGVEYGHLLEAGQAQARAVAPKSLLTRAIEWLVFNLLFMNMLLLRLFSRAMWLYQKLGLQSLVRDLGLLKVMRLERSEALLPVINNTFFYARGQQYSPAPVAGHTAPPHYHRVALLTGCVQSVVFAHVHEATINTLQVNGCEVVLPPGQQCCGALHQHGGDFEHARELARKNIDALEAVNPDFIVINAAGCSHHVKEYAHLLRDDPQYAERARQLAAKTREITELLAELGPIPPTTPLPWRVTYQDSCHLAHGQKITSQPRQVLQSIPALNLVEMKDAAMCCGSAGTYNIVQPEMADKLLADKLENATATNALIIASANTGCMIQLQAGLNAQDDPTEVRHVVEILDVAYRLDGRYNDRMMPINDAKQRPTLDAETTILIGVALAIPAFLAWLLLGRRKKRC
jgi:glycolate oxidase iron-sulfur subunit